MIPTILYLGPFPVNSFGLMVALSLMVGIQRLMISFGRDGIPERLAERYVLWGGFLGLVGARFWYIGDHWVEVKDNLRESLTSGAGFVFYGGLITAFFVVWFLLRRDKVPLHRFLDAAGPALALGYAVGRLGCQLSGDGDYGAVTDSFIGMSYGTGIVPTPPGVLVFPTPFFESTLALGIAWVLGRVEQSSWQGWRVPGSRFGLYLTLISLERLSVEYWRINPRVLGGFLSEAQGIAIVLVAIGSALLFRSYRLAGIAR
jgi:phosphatidylglycerol:prolipoprotein diacylglycerol transferase